MQLSRSRGALSGLALVILGIWGGLVPFVGPIFGYAYTPDTAWYFTMGRFWLEVLPALAVVLGGIALLVATQRVIALFGALLAVAGGAWFVLGPILSQLWDGGEPAAGSPAGATTTLAVAEQVGFFYGLGVVVLIIASVALGRMSLVGLRDLRAIEAERENARTADAVDVRDEPASEPTVAHGEYADERRTDEHIEAQPTSGAYRTGSSTDDGAAVPAAPIGEDATHIPSHRRIDEDETDER